MKIMPAKEIKALRQQGKLAEALELAQAELAAEPDNIWPKRNISWVYYDYLKQNTAPEHFDDFLLWLTKIADLNLPEEEKMLFDHLSWQIGSIVFKTFNSGFAHYGKMIQLVGLAQSFPYTRPSEGYSFLFKAFHKALKDTEVYLQFADWWDFENFRPEDYQKEKLKDGKEIMALAEQAYITYAKHLLPDKQPDGNVIFDRTRIESFLPKLEELGNKYPFYQYPAYFQAKLLLSLGDRENMLSALIPFARKKQNDFWVWEILSEAFTQDEEKVFALYCRALSCQSPEEMLINLRQKMAAMLIRKQMFNEARTEIELLVAARNEKGYRIPDVVNNWQSQEWYISAVNLKNNKKLYNQYKYIADGVLFADIPEINVIVEFVNTDRKILNFIASESSQGFFKYERFLRNVNIGDVLKVRFQSGTPAGLFKAYTVTKADDAGFRNQFYKEVEGIVHIPAGKSFGFLDDVFIQPSLVTKHKLTDGALVKATAIKSYNETKKQWGWKISEILLTLKKEETFDIKSLIQKAGDPFKELIIKFISVYFPFSVKQVIQYKDILCLGSYNTADISINTSIDIYTIGLIFNSQLDWEDETLKSFINSCDYFSVSGPITFSDVLLSMPRAVYEDRINAFLSEGCNYEQIPKNLMDQYKDEFDKSCSDVLQNNKQDLLCLKTIFDLFLYNSEKGLTDKEILQNPGIWNDLLAKHITRENIDQILGEYNADFILALNEKCGPIF